jgi:hypothetical protein
MPKKISRKFIDCNSLIETNIRPPKQGKAPFLWGVKISLFIRIDSYVIDL